MPKTYKERSRDLVAYIRHATPGGEYRDFVGHTARDYVCQKPAHQDVPYGIFVRYETRHSLFTGKIECKRTRQKIYVQDDNTVVAENLSEPKLVTAHPAFWYSYDAVWKTHMEGVNRAHSARS